jgi:hypothetical protein
MNIKDLGGRKFIFAILIVFMSFELAVTGKISFDEFTGIALWALGIFSVSNAVKGGRTSSGGVTTTVNSTRVDIPPDS